MYSTRTIALSGNEIILLSNTLTPYINSYLVADKIDRIDLLDATNNIVGHISFNYSADDFYANKMVDALLYFHPYPTNANQTNYPGWNYYSSSTEKMVSMLIPPYGSFDAIDYNKRPLLLVHGVDGEYPYWGQSFIDGLSGTYDTWQFYYPYNQEIPSSGLLLRDALLKISATGGPIQTGSYIQKEVNIVAHSMGGLVTRSYIQSSSYQNNIYKFVMLGTPNYGSYSVYRARKQPLSGLVALIQGKDINSPAYRQMIPGSNFYFSLHANTPKELQPGITIDRGYLVIAGSLDWIPGFHTEIKDQEDGVVAVSSANLFNYGIPLATVNQKHG
ncbi:MAG: hypothetical protein Q8M94_17685, partial [Ignavibacteria bacterium]|nr:hypothetical protein [Ignavibacteria bacterium]